MIKDDLYKEELACFFCLFYSELVSQLAYLAVMSSRVFQ